MVLRLLILLPLVLLSACTGMKVEVAEKSLFDASQHQFYAWENTPMVNNSGREEVIFKVDAILRVQVNEQLQRRGYQMAGREQADFLVAYQYLVSLEADQGGIISPTDEAAAARDLGDDVNNTRIYNHPVNPYIQRAKLALELTDPAGKKLWRAVGQQLVEDESPSDNALRQSLTRITGKMFRGFPDRD